MTKADVVRLAEHAANENRARVGYRYEGRAAEVAWAAEHLPQSRLEFEIVREAVHAGGWHADAVSLAEVLLGGKSFLDSFGRWQISGGNQGLFAAWTKAPKGKQSPTSFRFESYVLGLLRDMAQRLGMSQHQVIRLALERMNAQIDARKGRKD